MTTALILLIVSVFSFFLLLFIKIPLLVNLPEKEAKEWKFFSIIKEKVSFWKIKLKKDLSIHNILQKILYFMRYISLKMERTTTRWLRILKNKSKEDDERKPR